MAYGFNDDRSKVEVYTADEIDTALNAEIGARANGDEFLDTRIDNILIGYDDDPNKDSELVDIREMYNGKTESVAADAVRLVDESLATSLQSLDETGWMIPLISDWQHGEVQWNINTPSTGHLMPTGYDAEVTLSEIHYADTDLSVSVDDGFLIALLPYSSFDEDDYYWLDNATEDEYYDYSYGSLIWHKCTFIPAGMYYRLTIRRDPYDSSEVADIETYVKAVHIMTGFANGSDLAVDYSSNNNIARLFRWKHTATTSRDSVYLSMIDIVEAPCTLRIVDDSIVLASVIYYDENDTRIATRSCGYVPKGVRFQVFLENRSDNTQKINYDYLDHIQIIPMKENYWEMATNANPGLGPVDTRVIMADIEYADHPMVYYFDDYTNYGMMYYSYKNDDFTSNNGKWHAVQYKPLYIQEGMYYRVAIAKRDDASMTRAEGMAVAALVKRIDLDKHETDNAFANGVRNELAAIKKRIASIEGDTLPSYYESGTYSLSAKCAAIRALNQKLVPEIAQFAFITDMHLFSGNEKKSRLLLNNIIDNTNVDMVVNGGDALDEKPTDTTSYDPQTSFGFIKMLEPAHNYAIPDGCKNYLFVPGNHDAGAGWNPTTDAKVDKGTFIDHSMICRTESGVKYDKDGLQYYIDDPYHKIRFLVCNYGNSLNIGEWDENGSHGVTGTTNADCLMFARDALVSMPSGWQCIVFNHILINSWPNKGAENLEKLCDAYNARTGSISLDANTFDLSNGLGEVICIIAGHSHCDHTYTTTGGINCILTTTDCRAQNYTSDTHVIDTSSRPVGTYKEQAFDVFTINRTLRTITATRIGYGSDRTWNY